MSKKRPTKKPAKKAKPGLKFPKKPEKKASAKVWRGARQAGPRSQVLPGMRQVRDQKLDELCEAIGDDLQAINQAAESKAGDVAAALKRMQGRNLTSYLHAGVRLTRVPGSEKVNVRLVKDQGEASAPEPVEVNVGRPTMDDVAEPDEDLGEVEETPIQ